MKVTPDNCFHLTVEIVHEIHAEALARFGGVAGLRDQGLLELESAVGAAQASIGGRSPYRDLAEVAGAYLYFLGRNHPFIDGNKRTALAACLVFLQSNEVKVQPDGPEWEKLTLGIANSQLD